MPAGARRRSKSGTVQAWWLLLPAVAFLAVCYVYPLLRMIRTSLFIPGFSLQNYTTAITSPVYGRVLLNTVWLGVEVTSGCLVLGYPVAFLLATARPRARNLLMIAVVLPYFTSILVRSYAWLVLLGRQGLVNEFLRWLGVIDQPLRIIYNTPGVLIAMIHILLPVMIFALYSAMSGIDWRLGKVAASLGSSRIQTFFRVFLPLSLPGIGRRQRPRVHLHRGLLCHAGTFGRHEGYDPADVDRNPDQ